MEKTQKNKDFREELIRWRRHLHKHPESAFEEKETAAYLAAELEAMGLEVHRGVGRTGLVANLAGRPGGTVIGIRADMDAICMTEKGDRPWASINPERMHACGHDGHMATLLGAARLLSRQRNFSGTVRFIFQPAEEPGYGARAMLEEGLLERFPLDEIYGFHNIPTFPAGTIQTRTGGIMASEDDFTIKITGKGSHSSSPHIGVDPLVTAAEIILALQTVVSRNVPPTETAVISCTELETDGVRNAIPSHVTIKGDTRSFTPLVQALLEERMRTLCDNICRMHGALCDFSYTHEFAPAINWAEPVANAVAAARNIVGSENVVVPCEPAMASEDFGLFLEKIPGCIVFLGTGRDPSPQNNIPLHNALYDYNDDMLETGAKFFAELVRLRLS